VSLQFFFKNWWKEKIERKNVKIYKTDATIRLNPKAREILGGHGGQLV